MQSSDDTRAPTAREAAADLRAAVHELAEAVITREPDAAHLGEATALVRAAVAEMRSEPAPDWWEGPADPEPDGLRSYRARSLFQGALHPFSPSLRWESEVSGPAGEPGLAFTVRLSRLHQGPPGAVHGGYVAGLFDELLGGVQALTSAGGGFTGRLQVRYRRPTPLGTDLRFHGWVVTDRGRRIHTIAQCTSGEDVYAEAEGLFVRPSQPEIP